MELIKSQVALCNCSNNMRFMGKCLQKGCMNYHIAQNFDGGKV